MIAALHGQVHHKKNDTVIILTSGVGYLVWIGPTLFEKLQLGSTVSLFTHTHVRQDTLQLFGFATSAELDLFELLLSVSGVGPKTAMLVVSRGVGAVERAITAADIEFFTAIPRLGKKNAQKIIIELKSKLGSTKNLDLTDKNSGETQEIVIALTNMGFSKAEITAALAQIPPTVDTMSAKIKFLLKNLGK